MCNQPACGISPSDQVLHNNTEEEETHLKVCSQGKAQYL